MKTFLQKLQLCVLLLGAATILSHKASAQHYWVGGSGNWSDTNHWATTSGGATYHAAAPGNDDDVIFDANSFSAADQTVTLDLANNICHDLSWDGVTNNPTFLGAIFKQLDVHGNNFELSANMTSEIANLVLRADEPTSITTNGTHLGSNCNFVTAGLGPFNLMDDCASNKITINEGVFNSNNFDIDLDFAFWISGETGKTINLGSSTVTCPQWRTAGSNTSLQAGTSTIHTRTMYADQNESGPYNYNNVVFTESSRILGSGNFNQIDANGTAGEYFEFTDGATISFNSFLFTGTSNMIGDFKTEDNTAQVNFVQNSGTCALAYAQIRNINATGGANFSANPGVDMGGNTGWNFTALEPTNYYWIGNTGDWYDLSHWATTSGGSTLHTSLPGQFDNAIFDENSFTEMGQSLTMEGGGDIGTMDWTNVTNNPSFNTAYANNPNIYQDFLGSPNMTSSNYGITFLCPVQATIRLSDNATSTFCTFSGGGVYNLENEVNTGVFSIFEGTLNTNGNAINCSLNFEGDSYQNGCILNLGDSEITTEGWTLTNDETVVNAGTSTIIVDEYFEGLNKAYYNVVAFGETTFADGNTFENLTFLPGSTITLTAETTQTIEGQLTINGTPDEPIVIESTEAGVQAILAQESGIVNAFFVELQDNVASGGAFYSASQSVDNGNNLGWTIAGVSPVNFYWVGGTGDWSDATHWATSTGGSTNYGFSPRDIDNVFFDNLSFDGSGQTVNLDLDEVTCANFSWNTGSFNGAMVGEDNTIFVSGDLALSENAAIAIDNFSFVGGGNHNLSSTGTSDVVSTVNIELTGTNTCDVQSALKVFDFSIAGGTLNTNDNNITIDGTIKFEGTDTKLLNFGMSTADLTKLTWFDALGDNLTINAVQATINTSETFAPTTTAASNIVANFGTVNIVDTESILTIASCVVGNLTVAPGKTVRILPDNNVQCSQLNVTGTPTELITIKGSLPGTSSFITQTSGTVDGQYLRLQDITGQGGADFLANNSIDEGNVVGWTFFGQAQTITFDELDSVNEDADPINLSATSTSGLPITYLVLSGPATVSGNVLTLTGPGFVEVSAIQSGDEQFNPAIPINRSFCSNPLQATISADTTDPNLLLSSRPDFNQWYVNGGSIQDATGQSHQAVLPGNYTVRIEADGCYSPFSEGIELIIFSVGETPAQLDLAVFPNPATDNLRVKNLGELANYQLYTSYGKMVKSGQVTAQGNIDVSQLARGIYILQLQANGQTISKKVILK